MPPSDIFDHGKDHGFAFGALENELIQLIPHAIFGVERRIALPNLGATGQNACGKITDLTHQIAVFLHINESASDEKKVSAENKADEYQRFKDGIALLTITERKIFDLYVSGKSTVETAEAVGIKENTLKGVLL